MAGLARSIVTLGCLAALAGCGGGMADSLGLTREAPDEFQVVQRAPLVMPPDYNLRAPQPGAPRPQEPQARDAARAALGGGQPRITASADGTAAPAGASEGQSVLLARAGSGSADPLIRQRVAEDAGLARVDDRMFHWILWWQRPSDQESGEVLDPAAEAARLRQAQAGTSVTGGPSIERLRQDPILAEGGT